MSGMAVLAPSRALTGKQFEELVVYRLNQYREDGFGSFHRPGVHAVAQERFADGSVRARLIQSLPDFQGVFGRPQREAVFDCKVCSAASFEMSKYRMETKGAKSRQLKFMYERAAFGSLCFFLLHWNERKLKTKTDPARTYAIPVDIDHPFWRMFEEGSEKGLSRSQCEEYGITVSWITIGKERTARPDLQQLLQAVVSI